MYKKNKYIHNKLIITVIFFSFVGNKRSKAKLIDHVNFLIGTDYHGHTFQIPLLPGGMVQPVPDTSVKGLDWFNGYHNNDSLIMGVSQQHRSGMVATDWGDILLMPTRRKLQVTLGRKENPGEVYRYCFSHQEEEASPGFYPVELRDCEIKVRLTTSERVSFHQYIFTKSDAPHFVVDIAHSIRDRKRCTDSQIKIINNNEIESYHSSTCFLKIQTIYFYIKFSKSIYLARTWDQSEIKVGSKKDSGTKVGTLKDYSTSENENIQIKVGITHTSVEQAFLNLATEIPNWNFNQAKENTKTKWTEAPGKIEVKTDRKDDAKLTVFCTALYHSLMFMRTFNNVDGKYRGLGRQIHVAQRFTYCSDFSFWDNYRAEMHLLRLIAPERNNNVINTLIAQYEQGGWLPPLQLFGNSYTYNMIDDYPVSVILDAYRMSFSDFNVEKAYEAVRKNVLKTPPTDYPSKRHKNLKYNLRYGYLPYDKARKSFSKILEYTYNELVFCPTGKRS